MAVPCVSEIQRAKLPVGGSVRRGDEPSCPERAAGNVEQPALVGGLLAALVPPGEDDVRAVALLRDVRLRQLVEVPVDPVRVRLQRLGGVLVGEHGQVIGTGLEGRSLLPGDHLAVAAAQRPREEEQQQRRSEESEEVGHHEAGHEEQQEAGLQIPARVLRRHAEREAPRHAIEGRMWPLDPAPDAELSPPHRRRDRLCQSR